MDFDATDDPTHGEQEGSFYHGYFRQLMYHPHFIFDGESGHPISALLRAGDTHASNSSVALLKRIVSRLRQAWPEAEIEIRADAGFAVPAIYDYCESEGITNSQTQGNGRGAARGRHRAVRIDGAKGQASLGGCLRGGELGDEAKGRHKAEVMEQGANRRFVVTTRSDTPKALYEFYAHRGEGENIIKNFKLHIRADRLSCHRFIANQFRLLLHACANWPMDALRRKLIESKPPWVATECLRLCLIKVGGRVRELITKVRLHLASGHPGQPL